MSVFCCEQDISSGILGTPLASGLCKPSAGCIEYGTITTCGELGRVSLGDGNFTDRYIDCANFTPTTVAVIQTPGGTSAIEGGILGDFSGLRGRVVRLEATPQPGFKFDLWEISYKEPETPPPTLDIFAPVSNVTDTLSNICVPLGENPSDFPYITYQQLSQVLYTDNFRLYLDDSGRTPAPVGYYGAGNNFYYLYTGVEIPTLQQCSSDGGTGGGGGGGEEDTRLTESPPDIIDTDTLNSPGTFF
jgi:hypothetical protein